jgi:hypothetical protein
MTDEERIKVMEDTNNMFKAVFPPLLSTGRSGIVAIRTFYVVAHGDGTFSAGNIGATVEGNEDQAIKLIGTIATLLADPQGNRTIEKIEAPPKH